MLSYWWSFALGELGLISNVVFQLILFLSVYTTLLSAREAISHYAEQT